MVEFKLYCYKWECYYIMLQLFNESRGTILSFKRFLFGKGQAVCYCLAKGKFADSCPTQRHKIQILKKAACAVLWANNQSNMHSSFYPFVTSANEQAGDCN